MKAFSLAAALAVSTLAQPSPVAAQSYPIDCAILLCLAGGWPASVPCVRARAEFIRRITPWPIEPPLQIWNCPLNTDYRPRSAPQLPKIFSASFTVPHVPLGWLPWPVAATDPRSSAAQRPAVTLAQATGQVLSPSGQADIDISGREFDFVRSIKVWHIRYSAAVTGSQKNCFISSKSDLGSYGVQGNFAWNGVRLSAAPAWIQPPYSCQKPGTFRAVGVSWIDYFGQSGHEMVTY